MDFDDKYWGHTKYDNNGALIEIQTLRDHLLNSQKLAEQYGADLSISHITGLAALLHDVGKFSPEYQQYIRHNDDSKRGSVDHSTFGGMFISKYLHHYISNLSVESEKVEVLEFGEIIENSIFSHHNKNGLKDFISKEIESPFLSRIEAFNKDENKCNQLGDITKLFYNKVLSKKELDEYVQKAINEYRRIIKTFEQSIHKVNKYKLKTFLTIFVYSCLLDADRVDTTAFQTGNHPYKIDNRSIFKKYYNNLVTEINKMNGDSTNPIDKLRAEVSKECDNAAEQESDVYTLSAPTGSGKTLASMRYALKHSAIYNKQHIIYVLPYITIIEQNARVIREKLNGSDKDTRNILEFHSNVSNENSPQANNEKNNSLDLAEDSWDSPIIFTTMVQFLNAIFASRTTNRRRFHNLCNSVIIFDEAQKVPTKCLNMFTDAIVFLKQVGRSDIVLCTATQPALNKINDEIQLDDNSEIIKDLNRKVKSFKRVKLIDKTKRKNRQDLIVNNEQIAKMIFDNMQSVKSILGIFNTIKATYGVYQALNNLIREAASNIHLYYLSTEMCSAHRKNRINEILRKVQRNERVICISTPLIEAGVDASFEAVYRSVSGVDSIIQAAGRCNRNGKDEIGYVYLINNKDEKLSSLPDIKSGKRITIDNLLSKYNADQLMEPKIIKKYFEQFYIQNADREKYPIDNSTNLDSFISGLAQVPKYLSQQQTKSKKLLIHQYSGCETIAKHFEVISDDQISVLAPYDEMDGTKGSEIISALNGQIYSLGDLIALLKKAQPFIVNVYKEKFENWFRAGNIYQLNPDNVGNTQIFAFRSEFYKRLTGAVDTETELEIF